MAISAHEAMKLAKRDEWNDLQLAWLDDPQQAANHMAFGMDLNTRKRARQLKTQNSVPTWV